MRRHLLGHSLKTLRTVLDVEVQRLCSEERRNCQAIQWPYDEEECNQLAKARDHLRGLDLAIRCMELAATIGSAETQEALTFHAEIALRHALGHGLQLPDEGHLQTPSPT